MKKVVTLGLIQMSCSESVDENVAKAEQKIRAAAESGAQIVCTQELYKSPYFCQVENADHYDLAEVIDENCQTTRDLGKLASELEIVLIASLFEKRAPGIYHNTAVIFDADGSFLGKYRKMHIPDDPHYYE
ncbi:MAG: carbon-nitrogen hydrolase, partial [Bacteroidetes bacterium]